PLNAQPARRSDLPDKQILRHRGKVVVDDLSLDAQARLVPFRAEFTAAADVGQDVRAALLEPKFAFNSGIARRAGDLESAVGGHQRGRRAVKYNVLAMDDKVRNPGSVGGCSLELLDDILRSVELWRQRLECAQ